MKFGLFYLTTLWHNQKFRSVKKEAVCSSKIWSFLPYYYYYYYYYYNDLNNNYYYYSHL